MRRSSDGLHGLVTSVIELEVMVGHPFVFANPDAEKEMLESLRKGPV
jgi:hypothetical protein